MKIGRSLGFAAAILLVVSTWTAANETLWIPAAACNPGFYGSQWSTDLWLYSRVIDETITITATFFSEEPGVMSPPEVLIVLPPNAPLEIRNIVCSLFGERRSGAIRLDSGYPFWAHSWTINRGSGAGIFGQGIPAYSQDDTAPGFTLLGASNRPGPDGVRTNIGIVNTSATTETVNMIARDPDTLELIGIASVEISAYQWFQANLFELLGVADQPISAPPARPSPSPATLIASSRSGPKSPTTPA
jgi:hypothetical protein